MSFLNGVKTADITKQKKSIRKIHNLKYQDHTHDYFLKSKVLKLPDLIKHMTVCYMQSGLHEFLPAHIQASWNVRTKEREDLRSRKIKLDYKVTPKQWINDLPPIAQAKLWNNDILNKTIEPPEFISDSKAYYLSKSRRRRHDCRQRRWNSNTETLSHPLFNSPTDKAMGKMTTRLPPTKHHELGT